MGIRDRFRVEFNGKKVERVHDQGFTVYLDLDGMANFGEENVLTINHEDGLSPGQFVAARIMNVPPQMSSKVIAVEDTPQINLESLTPAFMDEDGLAEMQERLARSRKVYGRHGNVSKPKDR